MSARTMAARAGLPEAELRMLTHAEIGAVVAEQEAHRKAMIAKLERARRASAFLDDFEIAFRLCFRGATVPNLRRLAAAAGVLPPRSKEPEELAAFAWAFGAKEVMR